MATINRADVDHLAKLARIDLTNTELDRFAGQLEVILAAVAQVSSVDTSDVQPMTHAVPMRNVVRPDVVIPGLLPEQALACAPLVQDDRFRVPRILDED